LLKRKQNLRKNLPDPVHNSQESKQGGKDISLYGGDEEVIRVQGIGPVEKRGAGDPARYPTSGST